jgi:energy-coupling factor transport system permease protein
VRTYLVPRTLHPGAWWLWALGGAVAASRTTNPIILGLLIAISALVVMARRTDSPWALSFRLYLGLAAFIVLIRCAFRILLAGRGPTVLLDLPTIHLPAFLTGAALLGPISAEALAAGFYDGLRLATMIVCVGAANALANPKRLLAAVPGALAEFGTAIVVALAVFPQLAESVQRVNRARMLRSGQRRTRHILREVVVPVLADALDGSLNLAAAMDARGYGRRAGATPRGSSAGFAFAVVALSVGTFAVLDLGRTPTWLGWPLLIAGALVGSWSLKRAGRRSQRTRYRPDRWRLAEAVVALAGLVPAIVVTVVSITKPMAAYPSTMPLVWPPVPLIVVVAALVAALPALATPPPPTSLTDPAEVEEPTVARPAAAALRAVEQPDATNATPVGPDALADVDRLATTAAATPAPVVPVPSPRPAPSGAFA